MFRSAIVRSLRASVPRAAVKTPAPFQIRSSPIAVRASQFTPCFVSQGVRCYSAPAGLSKNEVEGRIVNLLKNFDKVRQNAFFYPGISQINKYVPELLIANLVFRLPTRARSVITTRAPCRQTSAQI